MAFSKWPGELWKTLLRYPQDDDIWAYYGLAVRLSGHPQLPKASYQRMLRYLRSLKPSPDLDDLEALTANRISHAISVIQRLAATNSWPEPSDPEYNLDY